jgi:flagellin
MFMNSVHTNTSAIIALQGLNRTNDELSVTQKRVSTGFRVGDAYDDAGSFAIAQGLRADMKGYDAIKEQLSKARGSLTVASDVARRISDTMGDVRAVLTKLADDNVSGSQRTQYETEYTSLRSEISRFIDNANFNGTNLLDNNTDLSIIANLDGSTIAVNAQNLTTDVYALLTDVADAGAARTLLASGAGFEDAMTAVNNTMASLGANVRTIDNQISYIGNISDATEGGIGSIVDADLAKESARLQALQIRQQLGTQTLSIANQAPQILLSLFQ